jgi:hypothetical protein
LQDQSVEKSCANCTATTKVITGGRSDGWGFECRKTVRAI